MSKPHSILVVDDEPEICTMLAARLVKRGYNVSTAKDGEDGLALIKSEKPDLVLLDVMMPGISGWDVVRALKEDPATQHVKIVMVTAIGAITNEITARMYGADAHMDKPFEFELLEALIRKILEPTPAGVEPSHVTDEV